MKEFTIHLFYYDQGMDMDVSEWLKIIISDQGVLVQPIVGDAPIENEKDLLYNFLNETVEPILDRLRKRVCPSCKIRMRKIFERKSTSPSETGVFLRSRGYHDVSSKEKQIESTYECRRCGLTFKCFEKTIDGGASYQLTYKLMKDGKSADYALLDGMKTEKSFLMASLDFLDGLIKIGLIDKEAIE